jgi:pimeloyl-ACP methyl ester carboxylesterase
MAMKSQLEKVTSTDGTPIAIARTGHGPALVIVGAGPTDRSANAPLAEVLSSSFTVFNYDRRGRGESGDTTPFSVDREFDDLAAVIGTSGGAAIALEAAARGLGTTMLALWEPPYIVDGEPTRLRPPTDYQAQLEAAVTAGRPGDAVELFFTLGIGWPAEWVAPMREMPSWPAMEALARPLVYDAAIMGDFRPPTRRLRTLDVPTLLIDGATVPWITSAVNLVARAIPGARRQTLTGQPHNVDAAVIAPALTEFFTEFFTA